MRVSSSQWYLNLTIDNETYFIEFFCFLVSDGILRVLLQGAAQNKLVHVILAKHWKEGTGFNYVQFNLVFRLSYQLLVVFHLFTMIFLDFLQLFLRLVHTSCPSLYPDHIAVTISHILQIVVISQINQLSRLHVPVSCVHSLLSS